MKRTVILFLLLVTVCVVVLGQQPAPNEKGVPPEIQVRLDKMRADIKANGWNYTVGYNKAMDYKLEDITGYVHHPETQDDRDHSAGGCANPIPANRVCETTSFPAHYVGWMSTVKDQQHCGSCWAFSSVGEIEAAYLMESGAPEGVASLTSVTVSGSSPDLSEEQLVSCNSMGYGCGGGNDDVLSEVMSTSSPYPGVVPETCFPYTAGGGVAPPCSICGSPTYTPVMSWGYITDGGTINTVAAIKQYITTYGSVTTYIDVENAFQAYTGGVFTDPSATNYTNHAVTLCGWDDTLGPSGCWLLKNSWGSNTGWGINGFMWIEYGDSLVGEGCAWVVSNGAPTTTYSIKGTVSGAVASGVKMTLSGAASATATTGADGTYTFSSLANGGYTVTPSKTGYTFSPTSTPVTINGADKTGVDFTSTVNPSVNYGFLDRQGRSKLCVNGGSGNYLWTILTGPGAGTSYAGTAKVVANTASYLQLIGQTRVSTLVLMFNKTGKTATGAFRSGAISSVLVDANTGSDPPCPLGIEP